jgi:hypothetical protein
MFSLSVRMFGLFSILLFSCSQGSYQEVPKVGPSRFGPWLATGDTVTPARRYGMTPPSRAAWGSLRVGRARPSGLESKKQQELEIVRVIRRQTSTLMGPTDLQKEGRRLCKGGAKRLDTGARHTHGFPIHYANLSRCIMRNYTLNTGP